MTGDLDEYLWHTSLCANKFLLRVRVGYSDNNKFLLRQRVGYSDKKLSSIQEFYIMHEM